MASAAQTRMIQRLAARGDLSVEVELRPKILRREWDGRSETTWWSEAPTPVWVVLLKRPSRDRNWSMAFFKAVVGWDNVRVENEDLDTALTEALEKAEPRRVYLDERVWEHEDFKRSAALASTLVIGGANAF